MTWEHAMFPFVNENIKCGYSSSMLKHKEYFGTKLFNFAKYFRFSFFAPTPFSWLCFASSLCYVTSSNSYEIA